MKKTLPFLLTITIIASNFLYLGGNIAAASNNTRVCGFENSLFPQASNVPDSKDSKQNYQNEQLGFSLNFPHTWQKMKIVKEQREMMIHPDDGSEPYSKGKVALISFALPSLDYNDSCYDRLFSVIVSKKDQKKDVEDWIALEEHYTLGQNNQYLFTAVLSTGGWGFGQIDTTDHRLEIVPKILPTFKAFDVKLLVPLNKK